MYVKNSKELSEIILKEFSKDNSNLNLQIEYEKDIDRLKLLLQIKDSLDKLKYIDFKNPNKSVIEFNHSLSYDLTRVFNKYLKIKYSKTGEELEYLRVTSILDWEIEMLLKFS